jgi:hypothetical protein
LLAGIYPVEFRDFFLGDMFCSQTYAMGVSTNDIKPAAEALLTFHRTLNCFSVCTPHTGRILSNVTPTTLGCWDFSPASRRFGEHSNAFVDMPIPRMPSLICLT